MILNISVEERWQQQRNFTLPEGERELQDTRTPTAPQGDAVCQNSRALSADLAQGARDSLGWSCGTFPVPPGHYNASVLCRTTGIEEKHPLDTRCCKPACRQLSALTRLPGLPRGTTPGFLPHPPPAGSILSLPYVSTGALGQLVRPVLVLHVLLYVSAAVGCPVLGLGLGIVGLLLFPLHLY